MTWELRSFKYGHQKLGHMFFSMSRHRQPSLCLDGKSLEVAYWAGLLGPRMPGEVMAHGGQLSSWGPVSTQL